jgi:hypothetical protein
MAAIRDYIHTHVVGKDFSIALRGLNRQHGFFLCQLDLISTRTVVWAAPTHPPSEHTSEPSARSFFSKKAIDLITESNNFENNSNT